MKMIASVLDPEEIIVVGTITSVWSTFGPIIEAEMRRNSTLKVNHHPSHNGENAHLRSAQALFGTAGRYGYGGPKKRANSWQPPFCLAGVFLAIGLRASLTRMRMIENKQLIGWRSSCIDELDSMMNQVLYCVRPRS
jgi:hypothetical protein